MWSPRFLDVYKREAQYHLDLFKIAVLKGNFEEAKTISESIYIDDFKGSYQVIGPVTYYFYDFIIAVHSGKRLDGDSYIDLMSEYSTKSSRLQKILDKYIAYIKAIDKIMVDKEPTNLVDNLLVEYKIDQLMVDYYSGINYINQGKTEEAKAHFTQIADENSDLFYVREAKRYLKGLG